MADWIWPIILWVAIDSARTQTAKETGPQGEIAPAIGAFICGSEKWLIDYQENRAYSAFWPVPVTYAAKN